MTASTSLPGPPHRNSGTGGSERLRSTDREGEDGSGTRQGAGRGSTEMARSAGAGRLGEGREVRGRGVGLGLV